MKRALAVLVGVVMATAACGNGNGDDDVAGGDLAAEIRSAAAAEGDDISTEEADCAAETLEAFLGPAEARAVVEEGFEGGAGFEQRMTEALADPDLSDRLGDISEECRELLGFDPDEFELPEDPGNG